jgi:aminoglycoside phosphotransferase (APT) family kinase protein
MVYNKNMHEAYRTHLTEIHSRLKAPDALVTDAVTEATGSSITLKRRIIAGEANEVYDVTLGNDAHVIVRISRDAEKHFEQEQWAIEQCGQIGLPVPEILLIEHHSTEGQPLDICVQRKLEGDLLEHGSLDASAMSSEELRAIVREAGEMLSRIHSLPVVGWGYLDKIGRGPEPSFQSGWDKFMAQEEQFTALAERTALDAHIMPAIFEYMSRKGKAVPAMSPVLTHNDFHPKHLMIKDNHVSGIIDFGEVSGHIPENDLAKWKYFDDEKFPIEWLLEGYGREKLGEHFDDLMLMLQLEYGLSILGWYEYRKYPAGVEDAKKKLTKLARETTMRDQAP